MRRIAHLQTDTSPTMHGTGLAQAVTINDTLVCPNNRCALRVSSRLRSWCQLFSNFREQIFKLHSTRPTEVCSSGENHHDGQVAQFGGGVHLLPWPCRRGSFRRASTCGWRCKSPSSPPPCRCNSGSGNSRTHSSPGAKKTATQ